MKRRVLVIVLVLVMAASGAAQAPDPFVGNWLLNLGKSSFPGPPPARPYRLTFVQNADGSIKGTVFDFDEKGTQTAVALITYRYDGKEYRDQDLVKGVRAPTTLAFTRIDPRTGEVVHRLNEGKLVFREMRRVAEDGRTMTFSRDATDRTGTKVSVIQVFDRQ